MHFSYVCCKRMVRYLQRSQQRGSFNGDNSSCPVRGIGTVQIRMFDGMIRALGNFRYVPRLRKNLISLGTLDEAGYEYKSKKGRLRVIKGSLLVMQGDLQPNKLYKLIGTTIVGGAAVFVNQSVEDKTELWHHRLRHISQKGLQELHKQGLLEVVSSCKLDFCEYCVLGKQRKVSFASSSADNRSKEQLSYIHSDVWGPAPTKSNGGARYFVTFMDDFSRKVWVYFMKQKSEVFAKFKEWKTEAENQTGRKIKYLRSDNGGEYTSNEFTDYCNQEGIIRHFTVKKNPQQNGAAERMNRTLMERERSMRFHAGLPDSFWAEAVNHASYLINRSPSTVLGFKSAEGVWSEKPVDYSKLRVFSCSAYAHIPSDERSKLKPKSPHCIFLGFEKGVKGFKLWDFNNRKKVVSRDVVFDETTMPLNKVESSREKTDDAEIEATKISLISSDEEEAQVEQIEQEAESDGFEEEEEHHHRSPARNQVEQETGQIEGTPIHQTSQRVRTPTNNPPSFQRCIALDKPNWNKKKPDRFGFDQNKVNYALNISQGDLTTYREAIASDERDSWISAMTEEMESLYKNFVWELVRKPKDRKLVGCKWVFRKKEGLHEQDAVRFKARLVAKGYSQKEGVDYDEIFSPVVKHTSIRLLLAMAAQHDMEIEQMDVKTAFLHGDLEETIFMAQPEGFVEYGKENLVCQLRKSLYGLKQSPRQWYKRFDSFMLKINFRRCLYDCCVYYHVFQDGMIILLLLYVDDMLIACQDKSRIQDLKKMLSKEFDMKDLGAAQKILGMEIKRDRTAERI
ncbi:hypothetical protein C1H46_019343 [Malus baccata]|uniref:Integrase catalytic domain-containing protein n=1 Tax=Malus baccata TaxID=106549 RepID=A0A540M8L8_MALBA|nr:hypothetical protein C1H46_019343 [Malus baccata]